jgi:hypothetical protein
MQTVQIFGDKFYNADSSNLRLGKRILNLTLGIVFTNSFFLSIFRIALPTRHLLDM